MIFLKYWLPVAVWALLIFYLSGMPGIVVSGSLMMNYFAHIAAHFGIFLVFSVLLARAFNKEGVPVKANFLASFFIAVLYALSDEYHQLFVAGRTADYADFMIDCLGVLAGLLFYFYRTGNRGNSEIIK